MKLVLWNKHTCTRATHIGTHNRAYYSTPHSRRWCQSLHRYYALLLLLLRLVFVFVQTSGYTSISISTSFTILCWFGVMLFKICRKIMNLLYLLQTSSQWKARLEPKEKGTEELVFILFCEWTMNEISIFWALFFNSCLAEDYCTVTYLYVIL